MSARPALDVHLDNEDARARQQALYILRNFADREDVVDAVFDALGLLGALVTAF